MSLVKLSTNSMNLHCIFLLLPAYLTDFLSLRLVEAVGGVNCARSLF